MQTEAFAAFIQSQAACAIVEAIGMAAENMQRVHRGESIAYPETAFNSLIDKYGIGHNDVLRGLGL